MFKFGLVSVFTILTIANISNSCNNIKAGQVSYSVNLGDDTQEVDVLGCITPSTFGTVRPEEIIIDGYDGLKFSNLPKDAFTDLTRLKRLTINYAGLHTIEKKAFNVLPKLTYLRISDNNLTNFKPDVFDYKLRQQLEHLSLADNKMRNTQGFANMVKLKHLDLEDNNLEEINGDWFQFCYSLQVINLSGNDLTSVGETYFQKPPTLRELYLDRNSISSIEADAFKDMSYLRVLSLRHNSIQSFQADIFGNDKVTLDRLLLSGNLINYLEKDLRDNLKVNQLLIDGNPVKCECWDQIRSWLLQNQGMILSCHVDELPVCVFPLTGESGCVETNDREVTRRFQNEVKNINVPREYCANAVI